MIKGDTFGRWTVLNPFHSHGKKAKQALCACRCGITRLVARKGLRDGSSTSCGCFRAELTTIREGTRGLNNVRIAA